MVRHAIPFAAAIAMAVALLMPPVPAAAQDEQQVVYRWPEGDRMLRGTNLALGHARYTEEDLDVLKEWGVNSVRIMSGSGISVEPPYEINYDALERMNRLARWCRERGIYVVLNLGNPMWNRGDVSVFWRTPEMQQQYITVWRHIAEQYADWGDEVAFDLMNEPHGAGANEHWNRLAREITAAIREVNRKHPIVVDAPGYAHPPGFRILEPTGDDNTVYSFHYYYPLDFTMQRSPAGHGQAPEEWTRANRYPGPIASPWDPNYIQQWNKQAMRESLQPVFDFRDRHDVPIWMGEFGCARWANGAEEWYRDLIDIMEEEGIGWAHYAFREWHVMDIEKDPNSRQRDVPRTETPQVRLFREYFSRNRRASEPAE